MSIVVQKYGGSSVADTQKLKRVAQRVMQTKASGHAVVVVVSAMGDTTDDLLKLAKTISANPDRRELDMLLSAGERISMALLSIAIRELGGDAISFTGSQSGIITNDRHVDARIIEVRPFRVQDELARGKIVVIVQSHDVDGLLMTMDEFGVPGKQLHVTTTGAEQDGLTMVASKENLHQTAKLRAAIRNLPVRWDDSAAAVSIIGAGITASHSKVLQGSQALRELGVRCLGIATSSFRVTWLVDRNRADEVVRLFHHLFLESAKPIVP